MAKKKIYKDDGVTEDFDAEAREPDETAADNGNISDLLAAEGSEKKALSAEQAPSADAASASGASTATGDASAQVEAGKAEGDLAPAANVTATSAVTQPESLPELKAPHPEAQAAIDLNPQLSEALKDAGNKLSPALALFREIEDKVAELEDEAKNRLAHARQKATECVAALEAIFKRG